MKVALTLLLRSVLLLEQFLASSQSAYLFGLSNGVSRGKRAKTVREMSGERRTNLVYKLQWNLSNSQQNAGAPRDGCGRALA